jgi:hypothetical protein
MFPAKSKLYLITIAIIILTLSNQTTAATVNVDGADMSCSDTTGTPYCTIQAAIEAASTADTVLVKPDIYFENINFKGKAITVKSDQGASLTIIDGGGDDTVVYFGNGETTSSVLDGFTLQHGLAAADKTLAQHSGGGIFIENASPTIKNNVIKNNVSDYPGFGIDVNSGSPIIDGNTISNNRASGDKIAIAGGGGISIFGAGTAQIINNTITDNSCSPYFTDGGGIFLSAAGTPLVQNNYIEGNASDYGGGISLLNSSNALIAQNIIKNNTATIAGGGIFWIVPDGEPGPVVINNTIFNNISSQGSGICAGGDLTLTEVTNNLIIARSGQAAFYCAFMANPNQPILNSNDIYSATAASFAGDCTDQTGLNGNISADPLFRDAALDDFHLEPGSPAIDKGDSSDPDIPSTDFAGDTRVTGSSVDMGAYEYTPNPGYLEFSTDAFTATEGSLIATVTVKRKAGNLGAVTVDYHTSDGTAVTTTDYTTASGTLTFSDGDSADKSFTVSIIDDETNEPIEYLNLALDNPTGGATLGTKSMGRLNITDDDAASQEVTPHLSSGGSGSSGCFIRAFF